VSLHRFNWVIEGELAAMAMPDGKPGDLRELTDRGVGALVNLSEWAWPNDVIAEGGLAYIHLPVPDFAPPQPDQVDRFVSFCDECIAGDKAAAVHCIAGLGRTGTMVACYLVHRGMAPQKAIEEIRRVRPGSIETPSQERAVHEYANRCR